MKSKMTDKDFMLRAIQLAEKGKGFTSPNPMVGALVVKNNQIVSEGWHRRCGGPHAETMALIRAGRQAKGAKLIVTLEPCFSFGHTPPCVDQVIASGVREVVIGMKDPNPKTKGKSIAKLKRAGLKVKTPLLETHLQQLNEVFVTYMKHHRPFIVAKSAQSLDGKIATTRGHSQWITGSAARAASRRLRNDFDAIMVGINTVLQDNPKLNASRQSKRIKKIVLDSMLKISAKAKLFKGARPGDCYLVATRNADQSAIASWRRKGVNVLMAPLKKGRISLHWLCNELAQQEISSLLIEGGAGVVGSALRERLVDKMHIYFAPTIIGDQAALSSVDGLNTVHPDQAVRLGNLHCKRIGQDYFLQGKVHYRPG